MKRRLDQFTMAQFIDIACGDYSAIDSDGEKARNIASNLMEQYNIAADPASAKARLLENERISKNDAKVKLYRILLNLINVFEAHDEVREILIVAGQGNIAKRDNDSLKSKIEQSLRSEEALRERLEDERKGNPLQNASEEDVRASFDQQTARLMAHFKFAINHDSVSASVYANLVNMACKQQRQQASK